MADMGVGEAALLSAAIGGMSAASRGQDPLQAALISGALGGIGGAAFGGMGAGAGEAAGVSAFDAAQSFGATPYLSGAGDVGFQGIASLPSAVNSAAFTNPITTSSVVAENLGALPSQGIASLYTPAQELAAYGVTPDQINLATNTASVAPASIPSVPSVPSPVAAASISTPAAPISAAPTDAEMDKALASFADVKTQSGAAKPGFLDNPLQWWKGLDTKEKMLYGGGAGLGLMALNNTPNSTYSPEKYSGPLSKFRYDPSSYTPYSYKTYADGGPIDGMNANYPQAGLSQSQYANAWQTPVPREMLASGADTGVNPMTGQMKFGSGGIADLGGYSDGGRLLRGPGDGVSDSIPAMIGNKQPARLADGEFVVPARIVSELGNGSTDAGAKQLYAMMDRVQKGRRKTVGKGKVAANTNAAKYLPA